MREFKRSSSNRRGGDSFNKRSSNRGMDRPEMTDAICDEMIEMTAEEAMTDTIEMTETDKIERCFLQFATSVEKIVNYHLDQVAINQYIVAIVLRKKEM